MSSIIRADKWQNALGVAYNAVLQVVSTTKTDTFTTASTTFTDITGLSATITPKFDSSKILVTAQICGCNDHGTSQSVLTIARNSTAIYLGNTAGSRLRGVEMNSPGASAMISVAILYLDSPASTSSLTYSIQVRNPSGTLYINRSENDTDATSHTRGASTITVMEIAQ